MKFAQDEDDTTDLEPPVSDTYYFKDNAEIEIRELKL